MGALRTHIPGCWGQDIFDAAEATNDLAAARLIVKKHKTLTDGTLVHYLKRAKSAVRDTFGIVAPSNTGIR